MNKFFCPICQKYIPKKKPAYYVGYPRIFLICRTCWREDISSLVRDHNKILRGIETWNGPEI